jgi:MFS family permease
MSDGHDAYAALRSPGYPRLLSANILGACGSGMQFLAIEWEIYQRTGSKLNLGFVGLAQFLPVLLFSIPVGHLADRVSRKWLFVLAQSMLAVGSASLFALSYMEGPVAWVYPILTFIGIGRAFSAPARWALLPQIVAPEALANAVTWNSSGWQVSTVIGPALGGFIIAQTDRAYGAYLFAAAGYLIGTGLISTLRPRPSVDFKAAATEPHSLDNILAGLRFVWNTPLILATITLDLFAVLLGGATVLLPVYAKDILHVGGTGLGWLRAAPSVGALAMALVMAHRPPLKRAGPALLLSVAAFGLATIAFGLSTDPTLSFIVLAVIGAVDNVSIVVRGTLVQLLTPDSMRGRVSAVNTIFIVSSNELGAFESGLTAHWFGTVWSVVGGGIGTLLVVAWVMVKWPQVAKLGPLNNPTGELYTEVAEEEIVEERT